MVKKIEPILEKVTDLPTLPQVVVSLMALLDDPKSSIRDINAVMEKDPVLVAKLLKLVNSAFYGIPKRVSSVSQAIGILGFKTIKSIVIVASVLGLFGEGNPDFDYKEFWVNSIGVATINRYIIHKLSDDPLSGCAGIHPDTGFTVGLISGLGKVILDQYANKEFSAILAKAKAENLQFDAVEGEFIDKSHADIGYWLARKWNLPDEVQGAIRHQNRLRDCPDEYRGLTAVLALSIYLCRLKKCGQNGDYGHPAAPRAAALMLSLTKESLTRITSGMADEFARAEPFFEMIRS